ncbi:MAG: hypothetical protein ABFD82_14615 [Syntrophaceae bacterium]
MKKSILVLGLSLVLLLTFGINVQAQDKEVSETGTTTFYNTFKIIPLGEGIFYMTYEGIGTTVSDTGGGLFHNATIRVLGAMKIEKGIYKDERGWGAYNLQNGDKVFVTYEMSGAVKQGGAGFAKGTGTIIGGTGKAAGIQGIVELNRTGVRSGIEGVGQSYTKKRINYTLP